MSAWTSRLGWTLIALGGAAMLILMNPLGMLLIVPGGMLVFAGASVKALRARADAQRVPSPPRAQRFDPPDDNAAR